MEIVWQKEVKVDRTVPNEIAVMYQRTFCKKLKQYTYTDTWCVLSVLGECVVIDLRRYFGEDRDGFEVDYLKQFKTEQKAIEFIETVTEV